MSLEIIVLGLLSAVRHGGGLPRRPQERFLDEVVRLLPVRREPERETKEALVMGVEESGQPLGGPLSGGVQDRARGQRCVHDW